MSSFPPDSHAPTPPILPPKPSSQEPSRIGTPTTTTSGAPPHPPSSLSEAGQQYRASVLSSAAAATPPLPPPPHHLPPSSSAATRPAAEIPDPGDQWLPQIVQDKSKQDIADILSSPSLLNALTHAPQAIHPSLAASHAALSAALASNTDLAARLLDAEARLARQRSATQAQLLSSHALERQWRQRQTDMDTALARFSPAALYQLLAQSVQEQAGVCQAMEESFLDAAADDDAGVAGEREAAEWIRRYREAKVQFYLRQERKERWDEGRVGGWR